MTGSVRHREPEWVHHALWWHVYPLGFVGAEPRADLSGELVQHRLGAIEGWLDHVLELGASGLLLGPVFASETHGYDTVDHFRIDPRLGDEADLEALVEAAGRRGIRVMLDGVFNHVARSHGAFAAVLAEGPSAPTASWFHLHWPGGADAWTPGAEPDYEDFEGHHHLVALNHAEPAVVDHVVEVMIHWLDRGIAGWRLDAAYASPHHSKPRANRKHRRQNLSPPTRHKVLHRASAHEGQVSQADQRPQPPVDQCGPGGMAGLTLSPIRSAHTHIIAHQFDM